MTKINKYQNVIDLLQEIVTEEKHLNPFLKKPIKFLRQRIVVETKVINFNNKKNEIRTLHYSIQNQKQNINIGLLVLD